MQEAGKPSSGPAVDRVAKSLGLSLGRSTVTRYAHADGNPSLDHIDAIAKVFGVHAWQLLHPTMGEPEKAGSSLAEPGNGSSC